MSDTSNQTINLSKVDQAKLVANFVSSRHHIHALIRNANSVMDGSRPASKTSAQALVLKEDLLKLEDAVNEAHKFIQERL